MANPAQERDQDVVSFKAFSGLRNDRTAERFDLADLELAVNVDIDNSGRVSRRGGRTLISATATHSLWTSTSGLLGLYVQGSTLYRMGTNYAGTAIATGLTIGLRMWYTQVGDRVYFGNGAQTGIYENGVVRSWGLTVPPLPSVTVGSGSLPAGKYQYVTTYTRNDGQESGAGLAAYVTVPLGGALVFGLAASSDPTVVKQNLYVSPPNGDLLFLAGSVDNAVSSTTYFGDTLELTYDLKTQWLSPPPKGHIVAYYRSRMFVGVGDTLYWSEPHAYELFDLRNYLQLQGRITLLASMEDKEQYDSGRNSGFFVGTDQSCGILVGSMAEDFHYVPKTRYGAILGAVEYVDGSLFADNATGARDLPVWLTTEGVCVGMPQMEIKNITRTKYGFTAAGEGAAIFQPGPNRLILLSTY